MAENSKIEWTHHTFNPWRGCTKVSDGCKFCYAKTLSGRNPATLGVWGPKGSRVVAKPAYWQEPLRWNVWARDGICHVCKGKGALRAKHQQFTADLDPVEVVRDTPCPSCNGAGRVTPYRARVFCASLADVFEGADTMPEVSWAGVEAARGALFDLIHETPYLDWLLLTKRPENVLPTLRRHVTRPNPDYWLREQGNVWVGTSVENQQTADERIPRLLEIPARVRFLSMEPLLGPVDLRCVAVVDKPDGVSSGLDALNGAQWWCSDQGDYGEEFARVDWVIAGGESGPHARPSNPEWFRSLRNQCQQAGVSFFYKQNGEWLPGSYNSDHSSAMYGYYQMFNGDEWHISFACVRNEARSPEKHYQKRVHKFDSLNFAVRVGKHTAGRLLDGQEWSQFPEVAR